MHNLVLAFSNIDPLNHWKSLIMLRIGSLKWASSTKWKIRYWEKDRKLLPIYRGAFHPILIPEALYQSKIDLLNVGNRRSGPLSKEEMIRYIRVLSFLRVHHHKSKRINQKLGGRYQNKRWIIFFKDRKLFNNEKPIRSWIWRRVKTISTSNHRSQRRPATCPNNSTNRYYKDKNCRKIAISKNKQIRSRK